MLDYEIPQIFTLCPEFYVVPKETPFTDRAQNRHKTKLGNNLIVS